MLSKESIAVKSSESGIETFIANGRRRNIICDLLQRPSETPSTHFIPNN